MAIDAVKTVNAIEKIIQETNVKRLLLHWFNSICWEIIIMAKARGYETNVGFEDTLHLEYEKYSINWLKFVFIGILRCN